MPKLNTHIFGAPPPSPLLMILSIRSIPIFIYLSSKVYNSGSIVSLALSHLLLLLRVKTMISSMPSSPAPGLVEATPPSSPSSSSFLLKKSSGSTSSAAAAASSPRSSSSSSSSPSLIVSVVPVGNFERVLKKESAKRARHSMSFGKAIALVVVIVVFCMWILLSSLATVHEPTFFQITNTSSGKTTGMLVTPNDPVDISTTTSSSTTTSDFSIRVNGNINGGVGGGGTCQRTVQQQQCSSQQQQQQQQVVRTCQATPSQAVGRCAVPTTTTSTCGGSAEGKPSLEASFAAAMKGYSI